MNDAIQPDPSALTPEDETRVAELVASVLADAAPGQALVNAVAALEPLQRPALAAALYEALCYRVDTRAYWLQYQMWKVYRALGPAREDAAFFHATMTAQMHPDWSGSGQVFRDLFLFLTRHRRDRDALELFRHQMQYQPEHAAATPAEIAAILRRLGLAAPEFAAPANPPRAEACRLHEVAAQERSPPWTCKVFGGAMPYSLRPLTHGTTRPAITVAEFADAELLIWRDSLVVLDRFGDVHEAFSVRPFPAQIGATFARREALGEAVALHEAEQAVVIADEITLTNLCHTLFDHLTRLALYERLNVDTGQALVIGAEPRMPAQQEILRRAGVGAYLGTDRIARVRARKLWVSSNCRDVRHAAHHGAEWAVAYLRKTLGGQGSKGWRRLYLSRGDVATRQVTNEAEVIALLEPHGFEAIMPGRMPYDAQLAAFRQASHVIAPHGAALTHLVLCPPGAHVLEIFHPLYGSAAYAMQAPAAGLDYAAMLARDWESDAPHWNDPTLVDIGACRFQERHMRVEPETLSRYLATVV